MAIGDGIFVLGDAMKRLLYTIVALWALTMPLGARADCSGWVDCLFGFTERTEVRNDRMLEQSRIAAERDRQIADIAAQQREREAAAFLEAERLRQQGLLSEAQARAQVEQYKASLQALVAEKVENIRAGADTQIAALQGQAQIATAGITEIGATERTRIAWGWGFSFAVLIVIGAIVWRRLDPRWVALPDQTDRRRLGPGYAMTLEDIRRRGESVEIVYHENERY